MSKFNNAILIENIKLQMKKHSENQKQLAEAIGMSQPNFNKAINQSEGKQFTLDQLYCISQHYGVTIDSLLGNKVAEEMSTASICVFIKRLIEGLFVDVINVEYTDYRYDLMYDDYTCHENSIPIPLTNEYLALVFPNREFKDKYLLDKDAYRERLNYAKIGNSDSRNKTINDFIKKFTQLYRLYLKNEIDKDILDLACERFIEQIAEDDIPFY